MTAFWMSRNVDGNAIRLLSQLGAHVLEPLVVLLDGVEHLRVGQPLTDDVASSSRTRTTARTITFSSSSISCSQTECDTPLRHYQARRGRRAASRRREG